MIRTRVLQLSIFILSVVFIVSAICFIPFRVSGDSSGALKQDVEHDIIQIINQNRSTAHRTVLVQSGVLTEVARMRSLDMAQRGYFSHRTPDGVNVFDMMRSMNIGFSRASENLWLGSIPIGSAQEVVNSWLESRGHKKNILKKYFTQAGVGVVDCGEYRIVTIVLTN